MLHEAMLLTQESLSSTTVVERTERGAQKQGPSHCRLYVLRKHKIVSVLSVL